MNIKIANPVRQTLLNLEYKSISFAIMINHYPNIIRHNQYLTIFCIQNKCF